MPYEERQRCGLFSYVPASWVALQRCPVCDAPLPALARRVRPSLEEILRRAQRDLGMDVAFLGELRGYREVLRCVTGDAARFFGLA